MMRRFLLILMVLAAIGMAFSIVGLVRTMNRLGAGPNNGPTVQPDVASLGLFIPEFTLTNQDGATVDHTVFDGRITILDFFFTHCPFICPTLTLAMQDLARDLAGTPVRFASISVDPQNDTPARLKQYATDKEIDLSRWTFMTGDLATVQAVANTSLGFLVGPDKDPANTITLPDGSTMQNIIHPSRLILVGPDRKVLGFYEASSLEETNKLLLRARAATKSLLRR